MKLSKWIILLSLVFVFACGDKKESETKQSQTTENVSEIAEPDHIEVQHLLVSFNGAPRMTNIKRSKSIEESFGPQDIISSVEGVPLLRAEPVRIRCRR